MPAAWRDGAAQLHSLKYVFMANRRAGTRQRTCGRLREINLLSLLKGPTRSCSTAKTREFGIGTSAEWAGSTRLTA